MIISRRCSCIHNSDHAPNTPCSEQCSEFLQKISEVFFANLRRKNLLRIIWSKVFLFGVIRSKFFLRRFAKKTSEIFWRNSEYCSEQNIRNSYSEQDP